MPWLVQTKKLLFRGLGHLYILVLPRHTLLGPPGQRLQLAGLLHQSIPTRCPARRAWVLAAQEWLPPCSNPGVLPALANAHLTNANF